MKKIAAILAIAFLLTACRESSAETMENEAAPQLNKANEVKKIGDSVGPVVTIPPR